MSPRPKIAGLALTIGCAVPVPANAQVGFDGRWSVSVTVEEGGCTGPYQYPIVVRDGIVDDASGSGADASGRVADDGTLVGSIRSGLANIAVEGRSALIHWIGPLEPRRPGRLRRSLDGDQGRVILQTAMTLLQTAMTLLQTAMTPSRRVFAPEPQIAKA